MPRAVNLVIVCEDILQETFVRAFLRRRGFNRHQLRFPLRPSGGDAKQHVCHCLCKELRVLRKSHRVAAGVIYVVDADNKTVEERRQFVETALRNNGVEPPSENEPVFGIIPKWEIENWLEFLRVGQADEDRNTYNKYRGHESDIYRLVEGLADQCVNRTLSNPPPSLESACTVYSNFFEWKNRVLN